MSRYIKLNREEYRSEFLNSVEWASLRSTVMSTKPDCSICKLNATDLHHLIYRSNVYNTRACDVVPLCRKCHNMVHDAIRVGLVMSPSSEPKFLLKIFGQTLRVTSERITNHRSWKVRRRELGSKLFNRIMSSGSLNVIGRARGILKCTKGGFDPLLITTNNRVAKVERMLNFYDSTNRGRARRPAESNQVDEKAISVSQKAKRRKGENR